MFLDIESLPDNKLTVIADDDASLLSVLHSRVHELWYLGNAGRLGVFAPKAVYVKSRTFDPFPFPDPAEPLKAQLRVAGEELDAFRKARQAEHSRLTLTQMYNVREAIRAGRPLTPDEERIKDEGLILILNELHDRIDALTLQAYGWPEGLSDEEVLERLVALNKERAAEERRGIVRWLRPDYQKARAGLVEAKVETAEMDLGPVAVKTAKPMFPAGAIDQGAAVAAALFASSGAIDAAAIAAGFKQGRKLEPKITAILHAMVRTAAASTRDGGRTYQGRRAA